MADVLAPPPQLGRLDAAFARLSGTLADALAPLLVPASGLAGGDELLRELAGTVGSGPRAGDGSCLGLPTDGGGAIDRLVAALGLGATEIDLLLVVALPHHHEAIAALLRGLHPEGRPWVTVGLVGHLGERGAFAGAAGGRADRAEVLDLLSGTVVTSGLVVVEGDGPRAERTLRLADGLWEALSGEEVWPSGATPTPRPSPDWGLAAWLEDPVVVAARAAVSHGAEVVITARHDRPASSASRLAAMVEAAGGVPTILHVASTDPTTVAAVLLAAVARDVVPVVWTEHPVTGRVTCPPLPLPLLLSAPPGGEITAWPRPVLSIPCGPLDRESRLEAQRAALPGLPHDEHPLGPATLEPSDLAIVATDLAARAALGRDPIPIGDVAQAIDAQTADTVPTGAVLVHPAASWDDLVLAPDRQSQLREAVGRMRSQQLVFDDWGFLRGRAGRRGLRLLFCGPPGTGKTLAAEVVSAELGRDLLVVDISRMVSKWIGETEKNLAATFDAAERSGATLFFDEADALFGKRTDVGDARDRYANLETAYLLSRLERFDGLAILATNLRKNLDAAFARRIEFIVPFDLPDPAARELLWRRHLPPGAPIADSVDLARLATLYELSGALIRNAAVAAAFLAASDPDGPGSITIHHLVHAIRREHVKAGLHFPGAAEGVRRAAPRPVPTT